MAGHRLTERRAELTWFRVKGPPHRETIRGGAPTEVIEFEHLMTREYRQAVPPRRLGASELAYIRFRLWMISRCHLFSFNVP
jgi:hypothetical protein